MLVELLTQPGFPGLEGGLVDVRGLLYPPVPPPNRVISDCNPSEGASKKSNPATYQPLVLFVFEHSLTGVTIGYYPILQGTSLPLPKYSLV